MLYHQEDTMLNQRNSAGGKMNKCKRLFASKAKIPQIVVKFTTSLGKRMHKKSTDVFVG